MPEASRLPLGARPDPDALVAEVAKLPREQRLASAGPLVALEARAEQIPALLREIGVLREASFRAVGEGTGLALDLDEFDASYRHILVWDARAAEVVGAYRLGLADERLAAGGPGALYTARLFDYSPEFFTRLGPAIELGRSFVRPERQRTGVALMLLWKGIGRFIGAHPRYRRVFGAVSVSARYSERSRLLIARALLERRGWEELGRFVRARDPIELAAGARQESSLEVEDLAASVAAREPDGKGLPVLLEAYLGLGARFLAFGRDRSFADVMDGLAVADLLELPQRTLRFYLGPGGADAFLRHHARAS